MFQKMPTNKQRNGQTNICTRWDFAVFMSSFEGIQSHMFLWPTFLCIILAYLMHHLGIFSLYGIFLIFDLLETSFHPHNLWLGRKECLKENKDWMESGKNACSFSKHHPKICCLFPKPPWCVTFQLSPLVWPELWPDPTWSGTGLPSSIAGVGSLGTAAGLAGTGPTTAPTANIDLTALTQAYSGIQQYTGWLVYQ